MVLYQVPIGKTMEEFTLKLLFTFKKIAFIFIVDSSNLSPPKMEHKKEKYQEFLHFYFQAPVSDVDENVIRQCHETF